MSKSINAEVEPFRNVVYNAPVTALHFSEAWLLAGEGPYLQVYSYTQTCLKKRVVDVLRVFKAANIHGIVSGPQSDLLCVHGGKSCCVVELNGDTGRLTMRKPEVELEDWIWDVTWLTGDKVSDLLAVALAHNSVILWDWANSCAVERVHCQEICILYTALMIGDQWQDTVMAAGTVFNQVVIWGMTGERDAAGRISVLHRLTGHDGVIFSIKYDAEQHLLCTVSDDRSLMLWKVNWQCDLQSAPQLSDWIGAQFSLVHRLYGHAARVWDVRFMSQQLVSVGEDAKCCVWNSDGLIVHSFKGHRGKSIWSLDVNEKAKVIATGGGDGAICLWNLDMGTEDNQESASSQPLAPPIDLPNGASTEQLMPRVVRLFGPDHVLIMMDNGVLYRHQLSSGEWQVLLNDTSFKSYSVLEPNFAAKVIAVGSIHGQICLIRDGGQCLQKQAYSGKVFSICWLQGQGHHTEDWQLLTCGPEGHLILWAMDSKASDLSLVPCAVFELPASKQRWVSAATIVPVNPLLICGDRVGSVHVYSLNLSSEHTGHIQEVAADTSDVKVSCEHHRSQPQQSFWKLHGKAGVTDVQFHGNHIYSSGRDGQYRQYSVEDGRVELLHSTKVYKGFEWIGRLKFTVDDMLVLGFHTNNFVVFSTNTHQCLLSIDCGGGHRAWDLSLGDDDSGTFVYIKAKDVMVSTAKLNKVHSQLKVGLHGREVMDVKYLFSMPMDGTGEVRHVCATASEDTLVNIIAIPSPNHIESSSVDCGCGNVDVLLSLPGHISSVRCLATSPSCLSQCNTTDSNATSRPVQLVFSAGGRAQMKCWRIHSAENTKNATKCLNNSSELVSEGESRTCNPKPDSALPDPSSVWHEHLFTYLLHHKGLKRAKPWKVAQYISDPETRFMDLTAVRLDEFADDVRHQCLHLVAAACSDAFVRVFCFDEQQRMLTLITESSFHDHCVLKVSHLITHSANHRRLYILSAGTDGNIAFWDLTATVKQFLCDYTREDEAVTVQGDEMRPCHVIHAHQSGINALAMKHREGDEYMLVSGGDDNALNVFTLSISDSAVTVRSHASVASAHGTQITGACICDNHTVITASIDQRLITWKLDPDDLSKVHQGSCQYVHVADVANLDSWTHRDTVYVSVCGVGLEVLKTGQH